MQRVCSRGWWRPRSPAPRETRRLCPGPGLPLLPPAAWLGWDTWQQWDTGVLSATEPPRAPAQVKPMFMSQNVLRGCRLLSRSQVAQDSPGRHALHLVPLAAPVLGPSAVGQAGKATGRPRSACPPGITAVTVLGQPCALTRGLNSAGCVGVGGEVFALRNQVHGLPQAGEFFPSPMATRDRGLSRKAPKAPMRTGCFRLGDQATPGNRLPLRRRGEGLRSQNQRADVRSAARVSQPP